MFFKTMLREWFFSIADSRRKRMFRRELGSFLELLSPKKNDLILDVGAGLGSIASSLTDFSDEVFALEPNEGRVDYIKSNHPEVKAFSAKASQIPFPTSYFNKLFVTFAFHHFPDQGDALEEFRRVTRKDGLLLINEMDPSTNSGRLAKWFETRVARNGANFLEPRELEELVASHGFKVVEERKGRHDYFVLAQNQKASDESSGWIDYDAPAQSNSIPPRE